MADVTCSIDECDRRVHARGWCTKHYQRWLASGDPLATSRAVGTAEDRFWTHANRNDGCWVWSGTIGADGYGRIRVDGREHVAHRWGYETFVGPVPDGMQLDHLCRNRACVRFDHLEPVTAQENVLRGVSLAAENATKTHCPQGHPYEGHNVYVHPVKGYRVCRTCNRERSRRRPSRSR